MNGAIPLGRSRAAGDTRKIYLLPSKASFRLKEMFGAVAACPTAPPRLFPSFILFCFALSKRVAQEQRSRTGGGENYYFYFM